MKSIALFAVLALSGAALPAEQPKKSSKPARVRKAAPAPARNSAPPSAVVIPPDATRVNDYTYVHTDTQGKTWTYRKTPFGIYKSERTAEPSADSRPEASSERRSPFEPAGAGTGRTAPAGDGITVTEDAETVTFSRRTPFGNSTWTRKKSELTADERELLERTKRR